MDQDRVDVNPNSVQMVFGPGPILSQQNSVLTWTKTIWTAELWSILKRCIEDIVLAGALTTSAYFLS
jgi:hypothetical protein